MLIAAGPIGMRLMSALTHYPIEDGTFVCGDGGGDEKRTFCKTDTHHCSSVFPDLVDALHGFGKLLIMSHAARVVHLGIASRSELWIC